MIYILSWTTKKHQKTLSRLLNLKLKKIQDFSRTCTEISGLFKEKWRVLMNSDILKTSYFVTQIRVDRGLDSSEEQFQKDVVSVSGFTGCMWMEEQFL